MMQLNSDLFSRKFLSSIMIMIKNAITISKLVKNQVGTVTAISGVYPNQIADVLLPGGVTSIPNIQNHSIHTLAEGDQVYLEMIYGDINNIVIKFKKQ